MQRNSQQPSKPIRRKAIYSVVLVILCAMALSGVWFADGVSAENAGPLGETIPPGGTVPPAPEPIPNQGQVNIIHVAPFASDVIDTGIQICDTKGNPVTSYIYYQQQTGYLELYMGKYDWVVTEAGSNCTVPLPGLELPTINVYDGTRLTLQIIGDNSNQPFDSMILVEQLGELHLHLPMMSKN
jgi:hypothetical protein